MNVIDHGQACPEPVGSEAGSMGQRTADWLVDLCLGWRYARRGDRGGGGAGDCGRGGAELYGAVSCVDVGETRCGCRDGGVSGTGINYKKGER